MSNENLALERIQAAGYRPMEAYPGRLSLPWLVECTECGEQSYRRPTSSLRPCKHAEREKSLRAAEAEAKRRQALRGKVRSYKLDTKNLRALEDLPPEGELWWVQCKFCDRVWHMPEDQLRACPHKGQGDTGHPPLPEPVKKPVKATPAPPPAESMTVLPGFVGRHAYLVESEGEWTLRVSRLLYVPSSADDKLSLLHVPLDGPSTVEAERHLRQAGWTLGPRGWDERQARIMHEGAYLYMEVSSTLLTEYEVGRDVLGSLAVKPEVTAKSFLKRTEIESSGEGRDAQGRVWPLYLRAEIEAVQRRGVEEAAGG